jgi:hypothetical protein
MTGPCCCANVNQDSTPSSGNLGGQTGNGKGKFRFCFKCFWTWAVIGVVLIIIYVCYQRRK